jgi:uncharacterized membrane protein YphA (DoxX/SURF4 family)
MNNNIKAFLFGSNHQNSFSQNIGFLLLRLLVGLALCTVFEKFFPRNGIWGPQEWFIQDTANMGFPFPSFFSWVAVLSEFFGGIFLMVGLFTRPAALLNFMVTFTATFIYHNGDIGSSGLTSFIFMIMCLCILLFGPGKFSVDHVINKKLFKKFGTTAAIVLLLFSFNFIEAQNKGNSLSYKKGDTLADNSQVRFYLKNNSLLPKKVTFIIYQPGLEGNNTQVKWVLPFQKLKFELVVKSKIYLASDAQIQTVMQGKRIDSDKPFIILDKNIKNTTLKLNKRE